MKIGLFISPAHSVPPNEKNILAPWLLVESLANGLVKAGHTVTLFAARGSKTAAKLVSGGIVPTVSKLEAYPDADMYKSYVIAQELALMREAITMIKAGKLDVLHVHQPVERLFPAFLAIPASFPVIVTFHDPIAPVRYPALERLVALGNIHFVSLSHSQQKGVPFRFLGVVPNGVDTRRFVPDNDLKHESLLITGRIVPQKGFHDAIEAAKATKHRLLIVGQEYMEKKSGRDYFENDIFPNVDSSQVIWESVVKIDHLIGHYQKAKALLFPIHWEEPFGLVMIEAMACGTPVIAYNRGSVSEIIKDGLNGFIVDETNKDSNSDFCIKNTGVKGLVEAIGRIDEIDRAQCRRDACHFSLERMIGAYERLYNGISGKN